MFFKKHKTNVPEKLPLPIKSIVESSEKEKEKREINEEELLAEEEKKKDIGEFSIEIKPPGKIEEKTSAKVKSKNNEEKEKYEKQLQSFFSFIRSALESGKFPAELKGHDLKDLMKDFHLEGKVTHEDLLNAKLIALLNELEELELEWRSKYEEKRKIEEELIEIEAILDRKLREFETISRKLERIKILKKDIPKEKWFFCRNGEIYRNVFELREGLERMDEETFSYHVNNTKNDFANWIKEVFGDYELANKILNKSKEEIIAILKEL